MSIPETYWGIRCAWLRYFDVFRKSVLFYVVTTFTEPVLYLLSFGLGVGALVGSISAGGTELPYRSFVFAGVLGQTLMFQGFYESSFGGFVRMYYQKIFTAIAVTPITLSEVLWGELLWDTTKATVAAEVVVLIGVGTGDFPAWALVTVLPLSIAAALLFSAMGLAAAALSHSIDAISYPQYLLIFPMFLFCGVFYPIDRLPVALQWVAWLLPLTSVNSLARTLLLGMHFEAQAPPILLVWLVLLVWFSRRAMIRRLVK